MVYPNTSIVRDIGKLAFNEVYFREKDYFYIEYNVEKINNLISITDNFTNPEKYFAETARIRFGAANQYGGREDAYIYFNEIQYSYDQKLWSILPVEGINIPQNTKVYFKGSNMVSFDMVQYIMGIGTFILDSIDYEKTFLAIAGGNIMSLLFGDDFEDVTDISNYPYAFTQMFPYFKRYAEMYYEGYPINTGGVVDASDLRLPATTLSFGAYSSMFCQNFGLIYGPKELPATTFMPACYNNMFIGCESLTTAPNILATTMLQANPDVVIPEEFLQYEDNMEVIFNDPELFKLYMDYIVELQGSAACCDSMFQNCTSLVTAPSILLATTLAPQCYRYMFNGCDSLITAPELPATELAEGCYMYMFQNCTSLVTALELPATKLVSGCYENMFYDCKNLNKVTILCDTMPTYKIFTTDNTYYANKQGVLEYNFNWGKSEDEIRQTLGVYKDWVLLPYGEAQPVDLQIISAEDVPGNCTTTNIVYQVIYSLVADDGTTKQITIQEDGISDEFQQNTSTEPITRTISFTFKGLTATYNITQNEYLHPKYSVDLTTYATDEGYWKLSDFNEDISFNNQKCDLYGVVINDDNEGYDERAKMVIDIEGYDEFDLYYGVCNISHYYEILDISIDDKRLVQVNRNENAANYSPLNPEFYKILIIKDLKYTHHKIYITYIWSGFFNDVKFNYNDGGLICIPEGGKINKQN